MSHSALHETATPLQRKQHSNRGLFAGYSQEYRPLGSYAALMVAFGAGLAACAIAAKRSKRPLPEKIDGADVVLLGVATHKLTRLITHDWVTSPLRAPFTKFDKSIGAGEITECARGTGMRRAMGELLTCPWCMGPWVSGTLFTGILCAPRLTRWFASIFSGVAVSDFLHHVYGRTKKLSE